MMRGGVLPNPVVAHETSPIQPTASPATAEAELLGGLRYPRAEAPFYLPVRDEVALFEAAHLDGTAVMLKGPTGCGKTRFVEYMAWLLGRPLVTVACHDALSASDLTGRFLIRGGETIWQDGALTLAARHGAFCYLDEIVESRQDVVVVIHPLTDHRRLLPIEKRGEIVEAAPGFQVVASYNPGYQHALKDLKPSTRQRFVMIDFDFPPADVERKIIVREGRVDAATAERLVELGIRVRRLRDRGLAEVPSTRVLIATARLIARGISPQAACRAALASPLTDDPDVLAAVHDLVAATI
jgi:nitric oxide reductase NorQ protein